MVPQVHTKQSVSSSWESRQELDKWWGVGSSALTKIFIQLIDSSSVVSTASNVWCIVGDQRSHEEMPTNGKGTESL